jgi:uncharacterized protein (DUF2147 family)
MKKFLLIICLFCFDFLTAQNLADDIVGYYYSIDPFTKEPSQNYIYKISENVYEGKVVWVSNPKLKSYEGFVFLKNLTFNPQENEWQHGVMYYPGKKGTYKAYMSFSEASKLKVRGYWGISMLGKTIFWTKEQGARK